MSNNAAKKITFAVTNIVVLKSNKKLLSVFFFFLYLVNILLFNYSIKIVIVERQNKQSWLYIQRGTCINNIKYKEVLLITIYRIRLFLCDRHVFHLNNWIIECLFTPFLLPNFIVFSPIIAVARLRRSRLLCEMLNQPITDFLFTAVIIYKWKSCRSIVNNSEC